MLSCHAEAQEYVLIPCKTLHPSVLVQLSSRYHPSPVVVLMLGQLAGATCWGNFDRSWRSVLLAS